MSRVRCQMSDSDNKAISVQVQLDLDLPTGTELGNIFAENILVRGFVITIIGIYKCCDDDAVNNIFSHKLLSNLTSWLGSRLFII